MEDQSEDKINKEGKDMVDMSKSITKKDLAGYVTQYEEKHGDMICPLCRTSLWGIPPRPDNPEFAAIITLPLPNTSGRGIWAYPLVCVECGYVASFATNHVSSKIRGE
ncbi:hypothetical protein [Cedecea neteri]|uniref:hypothetical protein n=1 Tax=Cedecea neteri TaxID=158822 RepID=UPI00289EE76E|nr:hypothetical protein [Cedecea neteri]